MANLSIISTCNRSCGYCFARDAFNGEPFSQDHISLDTFERALDFLERSQIDQVRLLGGEPTLHPQFEQLVRRVMTRGMNLLIFSNGQMPENARQCLIETPGDRVRILINLTSGQSIGSWEADGHQKKTMGVLGQSIMPGINICQPDVVLDGLFDLIDHYHLLPSVRIGLAQPNMSRSNQYLHPGQYQRVGHLLTGFAREAAERGVALEFDCGFVPCMFPPEAHELLTEAGAGIGRRCNPILDILPDGTVASCYPLSGVCAGMLSSDITADELRSLFEKQLEAYRTIGVFRDCCVCQWFLTEHCHGGCLAAAITRLRPTVPEHSRIRLEQAINHRLRLDDPDTAGPGEDAAPTRQHIQRDFSSPKNGIGWILPYIDQPTEFWQELALRYGSHIREIYFPLPLEGMGSSRPPQTEAHLNDFLESAPLNASVLINPIVLPYPIEKLSVPVMERLRTLCDRHPIKSVTVANPELGRCIREQVPELELTASVVMDIHTPHQVAMIDGIFDHLVPATRIVRDKEALQRLRHAFNGNIRLMLNEACLPGCPYRAQHFFEMCKGTAPPKSLCNRLLTDNPWLRLTGAWVLPQHLDLYTGLYDDLKLAGRVTLNNPLDYLRVIDAYVQRRPLTPDAIGGGPASLLSPMTINRDFFAHTLACKHQCHQCDHCRNYYLQGQSHGR